MKKIILLLMVSMICSAASAAWNPWESDATNPDHNFLWSNPLNYATNNLPTAEDEVATHTWNENFQYPLIIDSETNAVCLRFLIGNDGSNPAEKPVVVNLDGGTLTAENIFIAGGNRFGTTFNILNGGYAISNVDMTISHSDFENLNGVVNVIDGTLECGTGLQVGPWDNANAGTSAQMYIYQKGLVKIGSWFNVWDPRANSPENFIDIRGGKLMIAGDLGDYQGYVEANKIRGYGGLTGIEISTEEVDDVLYTVYQADGFYFDPVPVDGEVDIYPEDSITLSWNSLPEPNAGEPLIDVYWNTDAEGNGGSHVLTLQENAMSVDVTDLAGDTTYYWKVVATDPNEGGIPAVFEEAVFSFSTDSENLPPVVSAGNDVLTYLTDGSVVVTLAGVVDDEGETENLWTVTTDPEGLEVPVITPADSLTPDVTITQPGTYTFTLTADDGDKDPVSDTMDIIVAADPCAAAKLHPSGYARYAGDVNNDCIVSLADFALLAVDWLNDNSLDGTTILE